MFFFIQLGISYDPMHAVRISKPGLTSQWSTTSRTRTLWVHESDLLSANDDGTEFAWHFFGQIVDFMRVYSLQSVVWTRPVFFEMNCWILGPWQLGWFENASGGSGVGHHLAWKSSGNMSRGLLFGALARLFVVRGPWRLELSKYLWKWVVGIGGFFCCKGCYSLYNLETHTDSSLKNGKKASTQDRKKWRVTGLFGNLQLMIQQHLLKTSVYRFQEHVSSSKHLLQLARVL